MHYIKESGQSALVCMLKKLGKPFYFKVQLG